MAHDLLTKPTRRHQNSKECSLCKQVGRTETNHYFSSCHYLSDSDKRFLTTARLIDSIDEEDPTDDIIEPLNELSTSISYNETPHNLSTHGCARRVQNKRSPYLYMFYKHHPLRTTRNSEVEINLIRHSVAQFMAVPILPSAQLAFLSDGVTPMEVISETHLELSRNGRS